jgi:hypothetical protein
VSAAGVVLTCPCGEVYELRPEYAGRLLECPVCRRHLRAGPAPGALPAPPPPGGDPAFDRDLFLLRQRLFRVAAQYEVWGKDGTAVLYVERPTYPVRSALALLLGLAAWGAVLLGWMSAAEAVGRLWGAHLGNVVMAFMPLAFLLGAVAFLVVSMSARPLRHVTIYRDDSRRAPLLRILQDQRVALIARTYTLVTPAGERLGRFRKNYLRNLIRKRWEVRAPGGALLALAIEDSIVLSLLRRLLGSFFGLLRTNYVFERADGQVFGEFNRKLTLLDRYVLDLSADPGRTFDRRLALALGILLDTGERR